MQKVDLLPKEEKILTYLAYHGPSNKYQVSNECQLAYSTVDQTIKRMISMNLVQIYRKEIFPKTGLVSKYYGPTIFGVGALCKLYLERKVSDDVFGKLMRNFPDIIPPISRIWPSFEKQGMTKKAIESLVLAFEEKMLGGFPEEEAEKILEKFIVMGLWKHAHASLDVPGILHAKAVLKQLYYLEKNTDKEFLSVIVMDEHLCRIMLTILEDWYIGCIKAIEGIKHIEKMAE